MHVKIGKSEIYIDLYFRKPFSPTNELRHKKEYVQFIHKYYQANRIVNLTLIYIYGCISFVAAESAGKLVTSFIEPCVFHATNIYRANANLL